MNAPVTPAPGTPNPGGIWGYLGVPGGTWGTLEILVPPILGVRGRFGEDLDKLEHLCVHRSLSNQRGVHHRRGEVTTIR